MAVPDLFGMTFAQASSLLGSAGINFGAKVLDPDVKDTANAFIYRQSPERNTPDYRVNRIRAGQMIDIWLGTQKPQRDTTRAGGGPVENNY
jgi:beta-lactam-binding protein with PASTA domain